VNDQEALPPEDIRILFSAFEAGELRRILSNFEPLTPTQRTNVVLRVITIRYAASLHRARVRAATELFDTGAFSSSLEEHRAHMGAIASHTGRLLSLLSQEPFFSELLHDVEEDRFPRVEIFMGRETDRENRLLDDLERVYAWASIFHQHPHLLREMRSAIAGGDKTTGLGQQRRKGGKRSRKAA
jgi:hypothetical protein